MSQNIRSMKTSLEATDDGNEDNKQQPKLYAKDSMDRFGDDLFGLILSYLLLEDRFRLECVSKQFQRTVFESVVDMKIDDRLMWQKSTGFSFNIQMLTTIAVKLANIQTIDCRGIRNDRHFHEVLAIFRDNCQHLREIYCQLLSNPMKWIQEFGPLVTGISGFGFNASDKQTLTHCHQLSHLSVYQLPDVFDTTSGQLLTKNLKAFVLKHNVIENSVQLVSFFAGNQSLNTFAFNGVIQTEEWFHELTDQLSRLTQLRELRLNLRLLNGENSLSESLRTIGLNCNQLQRLALNLHLNKEFNGQTLDSLQCYRQLKRLNLTLCHTIDEEVVEPLKLCHRLTHLTLNFYPINANLFANCAEHWPQLHYLSISTSYMSRECLSHISRLPALKKLVRQSPHTTHLSDNDFNDLLSRSPKLKSLTINGSIKWFSMS